MQSRAERDSRNAFRIDGQLPPVFTPLFPASSGALISVHLFLPFRLLVFLFLVSGVVPQAESAVPGGGDDLVFEGMPTDVSDALAVVEESTDDLPGQRVPNDHAARGTAGINVALTRRERRRKVASEADGKEGREVYILQNCANFYVKFRVFSN